MFTIDTFNLGSPLGEKSGLAVLRSIEHRGTGNVAQRIRGCLGQVFQFAIATGRCERNPAKELEGALKPVKHGHYAAITDPKEVGALLRAIDAYQGSDEVRDAAPGADVCAA
jgi:hypothetical protein